MLKIEFKTDSAAFNRKPATETARILHQIARDIEHGDFLEGAPILDTDGSRIGQWSLELPTVPVYPGDDNETADDSECAREGGHWNDGTDICERCGADLQPEE